MLTPMYYFFFPYSWNMNNNPCPIGLWELNETVARHDKSIPPPIHPFIPSSLHLCICPSFYLFNQCYDSFLSPGLAFQQLKSKGSQRNKASDPGIRSNVLTRICPFARPYASDNRGGSWQAFLVLVTGIESFMCYRQSSLPQNRHPHEAKGWTCNWGYISRSRVYPEGWDRGNKHVTLGELIILGEELCKSMKLLDKSGPRQKCESDWIVFYLPASGPGTLLPPVASTLSLALTKCHLSSFVVPRRN